MKDLKNKFNSKDITRFDSIETLINCAKCLNNYEMVNIIAKKDFIIDVLRYLFTQYSVNIDCFNMEFDYDKEYVLELAFDMEDDQCCCLSIYEAYDESEKQYYGADGFILFHEDASSKALIDLLNDHYSEISGYEWFTIGKDDVDEPVENDDTDKKPTASKSVYKVNGKECSKEEFDKKCEEFEEMYLDNVKNMLLGYCSFMDEVNEWRSRLLR